MPPSPLESGVYYVRAKNNNTGCWGPSSHVSFADLSFPSYATQLSDDIVNNVTSYSYRVAKWSTNRR